ncbi:MAG: hypothetical protein LBT55_00590 [Clostridiaceae bacterium]|jgi:hypothetical protein|nr:hypothetical protein [Clostridiaceae bacterium]
MRIIKQVKKNTGTAIETINGIRPYAKDEELIHSIIAQRERLQDISNRAEQGLSESERSDAELGTLQKTALKGSIFLSSLAGRSNKKIAALLIDSANDSINNITEEINKLNDLGAPVPPIANELVGIYNRNIGELRNFL